jgi:hypothetical protein
VWYTSRMHEATIQQSIIHALQAAGVLFFAVPNEGHGGNARRALYLISLGQKNGVADLVVLRPGRVVFLEVKTAKSRQSQAQKDFEDLCKSLDLEYYVVRSVEEALGCIGAG